MNSRKPMVDYTQLALERYGDEALTQRCLRCREVVPTKAVGYCLHIGLIGAYCYRCQTDMGHATWMKPQVVDYADYDAVLRAFGYLGTLKAKYLITDEIPSSEPCHEPPRVYEVTEHRERLREFANHLLLNGKRRAREWVAYSVRVLLEEQLLRFPVPDRGVVSPLQGDQVLYSSGRHYIVLYPRIFEELLGFVTTQFYQERGSILVRVPTREGDRRGLVLGNQVVWNSR